MKLVTAILQPHAVDEVQIALHQHGINGMTLTEVSGYARQRGHTEVYRGDAVTIDFTDKVKLEILVPGDEAWAIVQVVCEAARTGTVGDGKVWVSPVEDVVRIRTSERGEDAV